jgi:NADH-quinone oxidoreductase subunit E/NADP-reducing hydrogenase subunit HndA
MKKKGLFKVSQCLGTACYVRGADDVLEEFKRELNIEVGETSQDEAFSLDVVRCVGACGLAPVVTVNGKVYGRVKKEDVKKIIEDAMAGGSGK